MLDNIREHSRMVCRVALLLTDWLGRAGVELHRPSVQVGALLHDIAKSRCLHTPLEHDEVGAQILQNEGYEELAYLVRVHVQMPNPHPIDPAFIVYYADKRVKHDKVVSLPERFDYIIERYGRRDPKRIEVIHEGYERVKAAEVQIFTCLLPQHGPQDIEKGVIGVDVGGV